MADLTPSCWAQSISPFGWVLPFQNHSGAGLFVFSDSQHPGVWPDPVPHLSVPLETVLPVHYYLLTIPPPLWVLGTASSLSAVNGSGWGQCLFPDCSVCITDFRTFCSFTQLLELHIILFFLQKDQEVTSNDYQLPFLLPLLSALSRQKEQEVTSNDYQPSFSPPLLSAPSRFFYFILFWFDPESFCHQTVKLLKYSALFVWCLYFKI